MVVFRKWFFRNEAGEAGGEADGGGFDLDAGVAEIADGLGFGSSDDDDAGLGKGETVNEEVGEKPPPAPAPAAQTPAQSPAQAAAPAAAPAPTAAPAAGPATPPRFTAEAAPTTWSAAAAQQWGTIPLSVREEIAKRESDMFRGLELYKSDANFGREMGKALAPMAHLLQQNNVPAGHFVNNLVQSHMYLANGQIPVQQRLTTAIQLLKQYGLELPKPGEEDGTPAYVDPAVQSLQDKVHSLESKLSASERQALTEQQNKMAADIKAFADDPTHPYFYDVADDMVILIKGSGGTMSYQDAYDRAVMVNPVTRAKETERLQAEAVEKARKEAEERSAASRKASGARVNSRGHQGGSTAASGSMDDTMKETLAAMKRRDGSK
jgi:hypothetical protein